MHSIKSCYDVESTIKKSRFIGVLCPCNSEADVSAALRNLQTTYQDASHIAFAYRIKADNGLINRCHDAGEPSGTAGRPIYQHLESKGLVNALLAVIRYFGGIKLGTGGLVRAYGNTAKQVLEIAELFPYVEWVERHLALPYKDLQVFEYELKKINGAITAQSFAEQVQVTFQVPKTHLVSLCKIYGAIK
jgi:uncharacterized YigZ family protein